MEDAPCVPCRDDIRREVTGLREVIPDDPNIPYDMKEVIVPVVDDGYFFEVMPDFAKNIVIGFARLGGRTVGIVANQPAFLAGVLDIDASDKAARFIRFCDCFNIPLVRMCRDFCRGRYRSITGLSGTGRRWYMLLPRRLSQRSL